MRGGLKFPASQRDLKVVAISLAMLHNKVVAVIGREIADILQSFHTTVELLAAVTRLMLETSDRLESITRGLLASLS
jgi:hypothetical protein